MTLKKISKEEFEKLQFDWEKNYISNGAVWDDKTNNLIAFPKYTYINNKKIKKYYKIIEKNIDK